MQHPDEARPHLDAVAPGDGVPAPIAASHPSVTAWGEAAGVAEPAAPVADPPVPPAGVSASEKAPIADAVAPHTQQDQESPLPDAEEPAPTERSPAATADLDDEGPIAQIEPMGDGVPGEFSSWLKQVADLEGSDLHVKVGSPPMLRIDGRLRKIDRTALTPEDTAAIGDAIIPEDRRTQFAENGEVDFAHSLPGIGRFRVNVFKQRSSVSMVLRRLRFGGPSFDEMGLPEVMRTLSEEPRGLILVTGPTGSGKTTTLAAMIDYLNRTKPVHIVTVEDPIEVLHRDDVASINQREVGQDTGSFLTALRAALRQDPDVILIGEMRDTETVRAALQAAETGHLVLS
ncbi:MAG: ATPase, T2SS/T4P/T4SS family, partial [Actinomycetota bacterium]